MKSCDDWVKMYLGISRRKLDSSCILLFQASVMSTFIWHLTFLCCRTWLWVQMLRERRSKTPWGLLCLSCWTPMSAPTTRSVSSCCTSSSRMVRKAAGGTLKSAQGCCLTLIFYLTEFVWLLILFNCLLLFQLICDTDFNHLDKCVGT